MYDYSPAEDSREKSNLRPARHGAGILPFAFVVVIAAKLRCARVNRLKSPPRRNFHDVGARTGLR